MDDAEIKCRIVEKLLRNRVFGSKNWTVDRTVDHALPSHEQGRGRQLLENEMIPQAEASIQGYGGQRNAIKLTDAKQAVEFLEENGGNVPFGF